MTEREWWEMYEKAIARELDKTISELWGVPERGFLTKPKRGYRISKRKAVASLLDEMGIKH